LALFTVFNLERSFSSAPGSVIRSSLRLAIGDRA
jgi:hypothetical protein